MAGRRAIFSFVLLVASAPLFAQGAPAADPVGERTSATFRVRMNEAMVRHAGPLAAEDERMFRELWAFPETIELLGRWEASEARRLAAGKKPDPRTIESLARHADVLDSRAREFLALAAVHIGTTNEWYRTQFDEVRRGMAEVVRGAGVLLHAVGETERGGDFLRRAQSWPWPEAPAGTALESVLPQRWPAGVMEARARNADEFAADLEGRATQVRYAPPPRRERFFAPDAALSAKIDELRVGEDPSLAAFVGDVLQKFFSGTPARLGPYFVESEWDEGEVAGRAWQWQGWTLKTPAAFGISREYEPGRLEVHLEGVVLGNESGDLWEVPFDLLVDRAGIGRYALRDLQSLEQRREAGLTFAGLLEYRLERAAHERQVREIKRRIESGAETPVPPAMMP